MMHFLNQEKINYKKSMRYDSMLGNSEVGDSVCNYCHQCDHPGICKHRIKHTITESCKSAHCYLNKDVKCISVIKLERKIKINKLNGN